MLCHAIQEVCAQVIDRVADGIRVVKAALSRVAPPNTDHWNASLLGAAHIPDRIADDDGVGDVGAAGLQARQGRE